MSLVLWHNENQFLKFAALGGHLENPIYPPIPGFVIDCKYLNPSLVEKYMVGVASDIIKEPGVYENSVLSEVDINFVTVNVVISREFLVSLQNFIP
jgi:hypothetical protein